MYRVFALIRCYYSWLSHPSNLSRLHFLTSSLYLNCPQSHHHFSTTPQLWIKNDSPQKKDYYKILGVSQRATAKVIANAFQTLSMKYEKGHDISHYQEIVEAYNVLSDPEKRKKYDDTLTPWDRCKDQIHYVVTPTYDDSRLGLKALYKHLIYGKQKDDIERKDWLSENRVFSAGSTLHTITIIISELEAKEGTEKEIELLAPDFCGVCNGTGIEHVDANCPACKNTGYVYNEKFAGFKIRKICPNCSGFSRFNSSKVEYYCKTCLGRGTVSKKIKEMIDIPAGAKTGTILRMNDGENDILIKIRVKKSDSESN